MAVRKMDDSGRYREFDPTTGRFIDDYPLTNNVGQVEHQLVQTSMGNINDPDEVKTDVIDENGLSVLGEDETKIKQFIKDAISVDNLVATFNDNSHETLLKLLALQDNKHPLKKGGIGIAYRTDALIMHCKMEFTADENIVFDAILGTMSSFPENKTYKIEPTDFQKFAKYADDKYLYAVFRKGCDKLSERHLTFENLGPDGEDEIKVPWFNILRYHKPKKGETAYIEFAPSDFFKDLALCSQLVHGAYGSLEVTTQLQGKYTIALYWYLENMKNYKEYPTATPGLFDLELDELKHQFSIPESYKKADIERRVLQPAKESINNVNECDFTFDYDPIKVNGAVAGYRFRVESKNYIDTKAVEVVAIEDKEVESGEQELRMMFTFANITFNEDEIKRIAACARRNNKDSAYMMQVVTGFSQRLADKNQDPVEDRVGYICRMIELGTNAKGPAAKTEKKGSFHNFEQRSDYDMKELERKMTGL